MNAVLLANGFDDTRIWVYLILAALGVAGSLFKKKRDEARKATGKGREKRPSEVRPRAPVPPRPARFPTPPRPAGAPPEPGRARPVARAPHDLRRLPARLEPSRPARVAPVSYAPPPARPRHVSRIERPVEPELLRPERAVAEPGRLRTKGVARPRLARLDVVEGALRDSSGLRAAVILSEILAPPVALRENHLLR